MNKIKIAIDVTVGKKNANYLKSIGYEIVCVAKMAEEDEVWLAKAYINGALFIISPDVDIPRIIERKKYPMMWVEYPQNIKDIKEELIEVVRRSIEFKMDNFVIGRI